MQFASAYNMAPSFNNNLLNVEVVSPMFDTVPEQLTADPVVDLSELDENVDGQSRSSFSMQLDDIKLGMTYQYGHTSEKSTSSVDVIATKDERALVDNLVAKNLGEVQTDDDIPDEEEGKVKSQRRHVFKNPRDFF